MKSVHENLDLTSLEFKNNAYKIYKELRENEPVHEVKMPNGQKTWMITRYSDAVEVLKDNERITKRVYSLYPEKFASILPEKELNLVGGHMLYADPPDHTRLRNIAQKAFTPRVIKGMVDEIQQLTNGLLDQLEEKGNVVDVIPDFAYPIPVTVICNMLGIPEEDYGLIREWSDAYMLASNNYANLTKIYPQLHAFRLYLEDLIANRQKNPKSDLTSLLVQAHDNGDKFSLDELVATIFVTIVGGHETTGGLISNGLFALLENPEQLQLWKNDPSNARTGVEELLRYYSPLEFATTRLASKDFTWHNKNITKGDYFFVSLASSNRDPEQFENPERLDITRKNNKHIAFSNGVHFCMGAQLARLEAQIAITSFLQRFPNYEVDGTLEELNWKKGTVIARGLERLPIILK
ncbi:cytochrome P450 family protein [Cytobacillus depressus]|nr:cytochrome P450 [Cytobacillus depressus]